MKKEVHTFIGVVGVRLRTSIYLTMVASIVGLGGIARIIPRLRSTLRSTFKKKEARFSQTKDRRASQLM